MTELTCTSIRSISFLIQVYSISFSHPSIQSIWHDGHVISVSTKLWFELYLCAAYLWVSWCALAGCLAYKTLTCHPNHDWKWRHFPAHGSGFPSTIYHHVASVSRCTLNPHLHYTIFPFSFLLLPVSREKCWIYWRSSNTQRKLNMKTWKTSSFAVHFSNALLFFFFCWFFPLGLIAEMGISFAEAVSEAPGEQLAVRPTPGAEKVCQYIQLHTPDQLNGQL